MFKFFSKLIMGTGIIAMRSTRVALTFPSQALPCSGSTGFSQLFKAPRGRDKNNVKISYQQL
jgi:hypothetical protein